MGLFGGKKTYVTSVAYNLAGDEADRPNFLKSLVIGNVVTNPNFSISETLQQGYIKGPGIKLRSFGRWSQGEYSDVMGSTTSTIIGGNSPSTQVLQEQIPHHPDESVWVQRTDTGRADSSWWADAWMLENYPDQIDTDWTSDVDESTGELMIQLVDGSVHISEMDDYDPVASYVYAGYVVSHVEHHEEEEDPDTGETIPAYDETIYGSLNVFIYKIGSGNAALDAMVNGQSETSFYFPIIPVRIDNEFVGPDKDQWDISELDNDATEAQINAAFEAAQEAHPEDTLPINFPELYPLAKKAVRKAVGGRFDDIATSVAKNVSLEDIDYAYVVFGSSLNTKENTAKQYQWDFFSRILDSQLSVNVGEFKGDLANYTTKLKAWREWYQGGKVGPEPERVLLPSLGSNSIRITADGSAAINYDVQVQWRAIGHSSGSGLAKPEAKRGDVWWTVGTDVAVEAILYDPSKDFSANDIYNMDVVTIHKQTEDDAWEAITIWGLLHVNWVYKDKSVEITGKEALEDTEESGFILPLHYDTYRQMSLVAGTQMANSCCYLVLNCYKVVKQKWYQTGIFQVFLIAAFVAITVATGGAGGAGLFGTHFAVGATLGFTGLAAAIVGGIANAIAAMLVLKAIGMGSTAIFGDKLGAIIGAIAGIVAITVGAGLLNGGNLSAGVAQLSRAENILALTNAAGQGLQGFIASAVQDVQLKTQELTKEFETRSKELEDLYAANIGSDRGVINAMDLTDVRQSYLYEAADTFLSRTLMTGSEVADFSIDILTNFAEWTISTDLP